ARLDERLRLRIREALVVDERANGDVWTGLRQRLDLRRRAAEPGVRDQMRGAIVVPVRRGDRREVVLPGRRSRRPADTTGHVLLLLATGPAEAGHYELGNSVRLKPDTTKCRTFPA